MRDVVLNDSLGIAADLDAAMAKHVDSYVDEWQATLQRPRQAGPVRVVRERTGPARRRPAVRGRAQPAAAGHPGRTRTAGAGAAGRPPIGGTPMSVTAMSHDGGLPVRRTAAGARCRRADRGSCRSRCSAPTTAQVFAIGNQDPFSGANVMSRGIVGSRGDVPTVASPMFKQVFDLRTGVSAWTIRRWRCRCIRSRWSTDRSW